jgi:hypothetical protein
MENHLGKQCNHSPYGSGLANYLGGWNFVIALSERSGGGQSFMGIARSSWPQPLLRCCSLGRVMVRAATVTMWDVGLLHIFVKAS